MRLALDTNRYVDLCRGLPATVELLETAEEVHLPFVVVGELRAGFTVGRRGVENERVLTRLLRRRTVGVLLPDESTTRHYAALFGQLRKQGTPIPTNDLWIAALVLQHDLELHSRDAHFDRLPQLRRA